MVSSHKTASLIPAPSPSPAAAGLGVRSCLRIHSRHDATSIAVCRAGRLVAFHFQTAAGEVIVTASEADFSAACRGARDHNGNAFTAPTVQLTPADLPAPADTRDARHGRRPISPERLAALQRIAAIADANQGNRNGAVAAACNREGIANTAYYYWRRNL